MKYGLIAEKLGHSFSKEIHAKLFDYQYELMEIPRDKLREFMQRRDFAAVNVTIPYKEAVIPYLDDISDTAKKIGAVNTVVNHNGRLIGYNTDFLGLIALIRHSGIDIEGKKALILGSGGTSKTALAAVEHLGCSAVYRVSRSEKNGCITYEQAFNDHKDAQIILNTTPCGMYPDIDGSIIDLDKFTSLQGVIDAVYNPLRTKLVCDALKKGLQAQGGLYMLVSQAAYAAEKFVGQAVPQEKIDSIYQGLFSTKQNIVLIGMPACGKTTVGKLLASSLGKDFIDTDEEIVRQCGESISDIFAKQGESGFRDIEASIIKQVASRQNAVIATGGGAVLREENISLLKRNGRIYFIDRPLSELVATNDRPLSSNREQLESRYRERYDIYCRSCDCRVNSVSTPQDIEHVIKEDFYNEDFGH